MYPLIKYVPHVVFLYVLLLFIKFLHKVCWIPFRIQYFMRSQGIKGPSYRFYYGNTKEISEMRERSMGRPMDSLSHEMFHRILPDIHIGVNLYGRNYLRWVGSRAELVVTEAKLIKEILNNKDGVYSKIKLISHAKKMFGDGLSVTDQDDKWSKLRKLANGVFHGESLKNMVPAMITSTETMLQKWKDHNGKEIEVFQEFTELTSEVISKTAFGSSYLEGKKIFDMLMKMALILSRNLFKIQFSSISNLFKSNDDIESEKLEQGIKSCIVEIIQKRDEEKGVSAIKSDFLGALLEASHNNDELKRLSIDEMVDECKSFYFAGHETTSSLLGWTILLLASHQDWQEKARDEIFSVVGKTNPDQDSITRLKTMNMIVLESLRLHSPVVLLKRIVTKQVRLGEMTLPPNMELCISPLPVQHDPIIWGEDVNMFKPDRFKDGIAKATNNTPAAFMAFGFGPRTCVGLNFAQVETKIALVMILQKFKFKLSTDYVHSPVQVLLIKPQYGIRIILEAL